MIQPMDIPDAETEDRPKLVMRDVSADDTVQIVVPPQLRPRVERYIASLGFELFQVPCFEGEEDEDLATFAISPAKS